MTRQFKVTVNGREYDVAVQEITADAFAEGAPALPSAPVMHAATPAIAADPRPSTQGNATETGDVSAQMGGVVVQIDVRAGQVVKIGDRLLVLEAMKMKSPVLATAAGTVTRILVSAGDAVEAGQVLLSIR
jgi:biotin carboxyl carrier protein